MIEHEVRTYDGCVYALKQGDGLRQSLYDAAALMMSDVLVNLHGAEHKARRLVEGKIFRKDVFLHYEKNFLPRTLEETIRPFLEAGKGDLVDIGYRVMMNLTVDFAGIDRPERRRSSSVVSSWLRSGRSIPAKSTVRFIITR